MLGTHGVDYVARREHIQLPGGEGRFEVVAVFLPNTGQEGSVEGTASRAVICIPLSLHFEHGYYSSRRVVGVGCGLIPGRAVAERRVSSSNADRGRLIGWD